MYDKWCLSKGGKARRYTNPESKENEARNGAQ